MCRTVMNLTVSKWVEEGRVSLFLSSSLFDHTYHDSFSKSER